MRDIPPSLLAEIRRALDDAPHGAKAAALAPFAAMLGTSAATIRRALRTHYGRAKRATGRPRTIPEALVEAVWDEKVAGMEMGLQARELPTRIALDRLARYGVPGAAEASVSAVNDAIRRAGLRRAQRAQRMEPAFALDVVHLDFSRSKYFQLYTYSPEHGDYVCRVGGRHLAYKEEGRTLRTWIASIVDGHSRLARARMYPATGEDAGFALLALRDFWDAAAADGHPMYHPARTLWVDRGSAGRDRTFTDTLAAVGVQVHVAQSKEAQGKIERQFRTLWSAFELPLALELGEGATITLADYNARLHAWLCQQARWAHPTAPGTRESVYAESLARVRPDGSPVARLLDADLLASHYDARLRTVDATGCVTIERRAYRVPERVGQVWIGRGERLRIYRYAPEGGPVQLYASLVDHPGEQTFPLAEGHVAHAHPVGRAQTPREAAAARLDRRRPQLERLASHAAPEPHQPEPRQPEPRQPTPSRLNLRPADTETPVFSFRRSPETLTAHGPREEATAHAGAEGALTAHDLRAYVGRRLAPYGLAYPDVSDVFDPLLGQATRADADLVLAHAIATRRVA